ncbi:MAG TPA: hypothetical protein VK632_06595, partial [Verrucomicrobiae bacterium]|nr:hypothetical protein [Verrucomicrobiae bacterium]
NYFVEKLIRIRVGPIELGHLPIGELRPLTQSEIKALQIAVGLAKGVPATTDRRAPRAQIKRGGRQRRLSR